MSEHNLLCPDCSAPMVLKQTLKYFYSNGKPRNFYSCSRWPACTGIHGADQDGKPLGIPATKLTREARIEAHTAFDSLWKIHGFKRPQAYAWLSHRMGLKTKYCHIGRFDQKQCMEVISLIIEWKKENIPSEKKFDIVLK